jgi:formate hydrogenlyase subunit 3/multisubunit Na+/H+ antiporter MnhD subunit
LVGVIGVIDSSLKMWAQVDLKKLVAYGTVQEMNLILIGIILGTSLIVKATSLFILAHTVLSTIFFLFSDSLYKRFSSRSTTNVRGLLQTTPVLGYTLFVCCLFFAGLPFTLKFIVEIFIFLQLQQLDTGLLIVSLFICNWFGIISFMKNWFVTLFGSIAARNVSDISYFEIINYITLCALLFILSFFGYFLI